MIPLVIAILVGVAGLATVWLRRVPRRAPEAQAALDRAVAAIDRELAACLELTAMFDQTHQAFVLENGQFTRHGATIERELPETFVALADLYRRIPDAETAMERRGPAGSLREGDRRLVETWEGDARVAQRELRAAAQAPVRSALDRLIARLPVRRPGG